MKVWRLAALGLLMVGCQSGSSSEGGSRVDAGASQVGPVDAGGMGMAVETDGGEPEDSGRPDVGRYDSGPLDLGTSDAGARDAVCGDGVVDAPELCDLGPDNGGDVCAWDCTPASAFNAFDAEIRRLMAAYGIPGGAVAVSYQGRLVLVRGYGIMRPDETPMDPRARFRVASISKPITSAAILQLVQEGRLGLQDLAFEHLRDLLPPPRSRERALVDPRLFDITVEDLLLHAGGWDRAAPGGYDPMFVPGRISEDRGVASPPGPEDIARYMVLQPLDFTPGERYAYSNFGYSLLGRIIERVTGTDYETHVRDHLLAGMGIEGMKIGATRLDRVEEDETHYFPNSTRTAPSVFDDDGNPPVLSTYGSWSQQSLDAHGGWISNTVDLLRFSAAVDGFPSRPDVLDAERLAFLSTRPEHIWSEEASPTYFYTSWSVRLLASGAQNRWHSGSLPGTSTLLVRSAREVSWVALFNFRPTDSGWWGDMDAALWTARNSVTAWPTYDLFERER